MSALSFFWDAVSVGAGTIYESTSIRDSRDGAVQRVYLGLRLAEAGAQAMDTIPRPPEAEKVVWTVGRTVTPGGGPVESGFVAVPFIPVVRDHLDLRGGFWAGITDARRFVRRSFQGDTLQVIEDPGVQPRPVTRLDRRRALEVLRDRFGEALHADEEQVPGVMPVWNDFFVDAAGYLWAEEFRPPGEETDEVRTWTLFSPEGEHFGAFDLPLESTPTPVVRNDRLVGVVRDSLDVEAAVVFDIAGGRS